MYTEQDGITFVVRSQILRILGNYCMNHDRNWQNIVSNCLDTSPWDVEINITYAWYSISESILLKYFVFYRWYQLMDPISICHAVKWSSWTLPPHPLPGSQGCGFWSCFFPSYYCTSWNACNNLTISFSTRIGSHCYHGPLSCGIHKLYFTIIYP